MFYDWGPIMGGGPYGMPHTFGPSLFDLPNGFPQAGRMPSRSAARRAQEPEEADGPGQLYVFDGQRLIPVSSSAFRAPTDTAARMARASGGAAPSATMRSTTAPAGMRSSTGRPASAAASSASRSSKRTAPPNNASAQPSQQSARGPFCMPHPAAYAPRSAGYVPAGLGPFGMMHPAAAHPMGMAGMGMGPYGHPAAMYHPMRPGTFNSQYDESEGEESEGIEEGMFYDPRAAQFARQQRPQQQQAPRQQVYEPGGFIVEEVTDENEGSESEGEGEGESEGEDDRLEDLLRTAAALAAADGDQSDHPPPQAPPTSRWAQQPPATAAAAATARAGSSARAAGGEEEEGEEEGRHILLVPGACLSLCFVVCACELVRTFAYLCHSD